MQQPALHNDAEPVLQCWEKDLVEILVARREGDVGPAAYLDFDRCRGLGMRLVCAAGVGAAAGKDEIWE